MQRFKEKTINVLQSFWLWPIFILLWILSFFNLEKAINKLNWKHQFIFEPQLAAVYSTWVGFKNLLTRSYVFLFLLTLTIFLTFLDGFKYFTIPYEVGQNYLESLYYSGPNDDFSKIRNLLWGIGVIAAIPFLFIRLWVEERKTTTAEQGHVTERLAKVVNALGEEKTVKQQIGEGVDARTIEITKPNIEVRVGAIYALERIMQDSPRDHWHSVEILMAYLRENSQQNSEMNKSLEKIKREMFKHNETELLNKLDAASIDIEQAFVALGRRPYKNRLIEIYKNNEIRRYSSPFSGDLYHTFL
jgi:hypothetical protein